MRIGVFGFVHFYIKRIRRIFPSYDGKIASLKTYQENVQFAYDLFKEIARDNKNVVFFDQKEYFCDNENCFYKMKD